MSTDYWIAFTEGAIVPTGEISITENGEVDVSQYATANVNVEGGGGGGGDLSTATVTMERAEGYLGALNLKCACITTETDLPYSTNSSVYSEESSAEFTAVLYKGKALAYPTRDNVVLTPTGNATYDSDLELYIITGDCTLTFADAINA